MLRRNKVNNEDGVVMVTTLMIIFVLMAITATLISLNTSQVGTLQDESRHIQAKVLAEGSIFYVAARQQMLGANVIPDYSESNPLLTEYSSSTVISNFFTQAAVSSNNSLLAVPITINVTF